MVDAGRRRVLAGGCSLLPGMALAGCNGFFISDHSTTTLTSSASSIVSGASITLTAKVTPTAATGTVTFLNGSTTLGTGTLTSSVATYTAANLPVGTDSVTAVYSGDTNYNTSTSAALTVTVTPATLAPTTTSLSASSTSLAAGMSLVLTAKVSSSSATGTVTFYNGTTDLGMGPLSSGVATFTIATLVAGTYSITAVYSGDTTNATSTSSPPMVVTIT